MLKVRELVKILKAVGLQHNTVTVMKFYRLQFDFNFHTFNFANSIFLKYKSRSELLHSNLVIQAHLSFNLTWENGCPRQFERMKVFILSWCSH